MFEFAQLRQIARQNRVKRLELFGSAARGAEPNDYDFLVLFEPMEPMEPLEHGRAYFRLKETLESALGKPVDLIEIEAVKNPYFLKSIAPDRMLVYAA
ncbi:nucleotidyltransferase domain-containing protein [Meiothermus sp.]|uniref:nucleotidyltransferase family protein n=1 Tax=Meiothermus sp. TaxID=1955249 RepID=UPI00307E7121